MASNTASEIWSATLSGCPSVTDSDVNRCLLTAHLSAFGCSPLLDGRFVGLQGADIIPRARHDDAIDRFMTHQPLDKIAGGVGIPPCIEKLTDQAAHRSGKVVDTQRHVARGRLWSFFDKRGDARSPIAH